MSKKALSPLAATMILVVFAFIVGTITMNWGKSYVDSLEEEKFKAETSIVISIEDIDSELKILQIKHITGELTQSEYLDEEGKLLQR